MIKICYVYDEADCIDILNIYECYHSVPRAKTEYQNFTSRNYHLIWRNPKGILGTIIFMLNYAM